jgi:hypothetical protein
MTNTVTNDKWILYNCYSNSNGPFYVLITDFDWYDTNKESISDWFDRHFPNSKPDTHDSIIQFNSYTAYNMWRMAWP